MIAFLLLVDHRKLVIQIQRKCSSLHTTYFCFKSDSSNYFLRRTHYIKEITVQLQKLPQTKFRDHCTNNNAMSQYGLTSEGLINTGQRTKKFPYFFNSWIGPVLPEVVFHHPSTSTALLASKGRIKFVNTERNYCFFFLSKRRP